MVTAHFNDLGLLLDKSMDAEYGIPNGLVKAVFENQLAQLVLTFDITRVFCLLYIVFVMYCFFREIWIMNHAVALDEHRRCTGFLELHIFSLHCLNFCHG